MGRGGREGLDGGDETIAAAGLRADVAGVGGGIAKGVADLRDGIAEGVLELDEGVLAPDGVADVIAGDELAGFIGEQDEQAEGLGLEGNAGVATQELALCKIEGVGAEVPWLCSHGTGFSPGGDEMRGNCTGSG